MKKYPLMAILSIVLGICLTLVPPAATAADYPSRPVKVIVPWAAGGGTDTLTRAVLMVMDKYFPQPMFVVNKTGGAGTVGHTVGVRSKPDGYTIVINGFGPTTTQPHLKDLQYTEKDYTVICQLNKIPRILIANHDAPYNNMKEMIAFAKENPGKINAAVAGIGTSGYLAMVQMEDQFGVKFTIVPQGGGAHQKTAVLGGHSDIGPTTANEGGPMVLSKQVKAIGVFDEKRYDENPDIPTMIEQGYDITSYVLMHAYAPAGTPPERVKMLETAFQNCLQDKSLQKTAKKLNLGLEFKPGVTAAKDLDKWRVLYGDLIGKLGLKKK